MVKRFGKAFVGATGALAGATAQILGPDNKWTAVATAVIAALTAFGVYQTPYHPAPRK